MDVSRAPIYQKGHVDLGCNKVKVKNKPSVHRHMVGAGEIMTRSSWHFFTPRQMTRKASLNQLVTWCVVVLLLLSGGTQRIAFAREAERHDAVAAAATTRASSLPRVVTLPVANSHESPDRPLNMSLIFQKRFNLTAFFAIVNNPLHKWHVYCPGCIYSEPPYPHPTCALKQGTDEQARRHHCHYATNGGPFSMTENLCIGAVVSDGVVAKNPKELPVHQCVGLSLQSQRWFFGRLTHEEIARRVVDNYMCAFDWLVFNGTIIPNDGGAVAPRTAIGVDDIGRLLSLEIQGVEFGGVGTTLRQTAEWMRHNGALWAINLDGGGSSATFFDGKVQGCPTCSDRPNDCCVRNVTTIQCLTV